MNNNTRKIVVLNNLNSPRIEQAIFILRDEVVTNESDAVIEAQKIVDMFGEETLNILEKEPEKLSKIHGISRKKALEKMNNRV